MRRKKDRLEQLTYILLCGVLLVFVLVEARNFLYPIFLALLFSYLLYPVVKKLEEWGLPGMFMAVPLLGMFKVYCDNKEGLRA